MFKVDTVPYCVWEIDIKKRNLEFLDSIDYRYFQYLAQVHFEKLDSDNKQQAAISLRTAYHHGLETLFTLLCAVVQAPVSVYGWALRVQTGQLRRLVKSISSEVPNIFNKHNLEHVTWEEISKRVHLHSTIDLKRVEETTISFAKLWNCFSHDFIGNDNINEYNSIKHGFRARAGGFALAVGLEKEYGVPPPPEKMQVIGKSDFGSSFFVVEEIKSTPDEKGSPNFRARRCSLNWSAESMAHALNLISMSINNVVSYLKIVNGISPSSVRFIRPEDSDYFEKPWDICTGVISCNMDFIITVKDIRCFSKNEIGKILDKVMPNKEKSPATDG